MKPPAPPRLRPDAGPARKRGRNRCQVEISKIFSVSPEVTDRIHARVHGGVYEDALAAHGAFSTHRVITDGAAPKPASRRPRGARPDRPSHLEPERHERWHPSNVAARAWERERAARVWEARAADLGDRYGIEPSDAKAPRPGVVSALEREAAAADARGDAAAAASLGEALRRVREEREVAAVFGRASALRGCQAGVVATDSDGVVVQGRHGAPLRRVAHCDRRECPDCARRRERAARRRAQRVLDESGVDAGCLVHATLTLRDVPGRGLGPSLDALDAALVRLRKSAWWSRNVFAALVRLEWTRSTRDTREGHARAQETRAAQAAAVGDHRAAADARQRATALRGRAKAGAWYHCHAHVLIIPRVAASQAGPAMACDKALTRLAAGGRPRPQPARVDVRELAAAWQDAVAGAGEEGGQAWIAPWSPRRDLLSELVKYLAKPADMRALRMAELREALLALDRRRMLRGWGAWRDMARDLTARELGEPDDADDESAGEAAAKAAIATDPQRVAGWRWVRGRQRPICAGRIVWRDDAASMRKALDILWERERHRRALQMGPPLARPERINRPAPMPKVDPPPRRTYTLSRRA